MANSIFDDVIDTGKLGMINICLNAIGEVPLSTGIDIDSLQPGTDSAIASSIITKTMFEVQNEGYFFNTDLDFVFIPDQDGFIAKPANLLRIDPGRTKNKSKIILKNGKFYDLERQDFMFKEEIKADVIWLVDYQDLPFSAFNYIAYRAAELFERATIASPDLGRIASINTQQSKFVLDKEHARYKDYNLIKNKR